VLPYVVGDEADRTTLEVNEHCDDET